MLLAWFFSARIWYHCPWRWNMSRSFRQRLLFWLFSIEGLLIIAPTDLRAGGQDCRKCHDQMPASLRSENLFKFLKPRSAEEKAVGIQDKGQVTNLVSNFGDLSNWHTWQNDALHWPRAANTSTHYSFGLGLIVAVKGNVISSVGTAFTQRVDWVPKDGSRGKIFSGEVTAPPPDETPFQAF